MITDSELQMWAQRIAEQFHPVRIILFGSYASGNANESSDVDLFIVMEHSERPFRVAGRIRRLIREVIGYVGALDVLVRTPEELNQRLEMGDFFIQDILEHGKTLYNAE